MKTYLPKINSIIEFIKNPKWLGKVRINVRVPIESPELSNIEKLNVIDKYLIYIQKMIVHNYKRKRGTNIFESIPVKDVVKDYSKKVSNIFNKEISEIVRSYPMYKNDIYVYDHAIVDELEQSCINVITNFAQKLRNKYEDVYLIRNDEKNTDFKLYDFNNDITNYSGFMPDFILYLSNQDYIYQIYIEPKGNQLLFQDGWKETLLSKIRPQNIEFIDHVENIKLYGVKFFLKGDINDLEGELENHDIL